MTLPPLPCPFCGSTNIRTDDARDFLACMDCHTEGPCNIGMGSNYAVEAWNRRAAIAAHVPEAAFGNIAAVPAQPGIRTLSSEQIERHTLTASECPPDSAVMLVSSINRLLGKSRGEGIRFAQPVAWMMTPNKQSHRLLMPSVQFEKPVVRADWELTPLYAAPQAVPVPDGMALTDDPWRKLYRRAINEANGLTNYVEDRPELRGAERRLAAIEAEARTLAQNGEKL